MSADTVSVLDVTRLRRRYTWLVLALALPALLSMLWLAQRQYETYRHTALRELAISADQRSAALDRQLRPVRDDVLRLRALVQDLLGRDLPPGGLSTDFLLAPDRAEPGRSEFSLDALPALLKDSGAQLLISTPLPSSPARLQEALTRAATFGEQAQLAGQANAAMGRAYFISAAGDQAWMHPWQPSASLLSDAAAGTLGAYLRGLTQRAAMASRNAASGEAFEPDWSAPWNDALGTRYITLRAPLWRDVTLLGVVAMDVPLARLQQALAGPAARQGDGRFWLLDRRDDSLVDHAAGAGLPQLAQERRAEALASDAAIDLGDQALTQRRLQTAPWQVLALLPEARVQRMVLELFWPQLLVAAEFVLILTLVLYLLWRSFTAPALQLVDYLRRAAAAPEAAPPPASKLWTPWFRLVGDTFEQWRASARQAEQTEALKSAIVDHALAAVITTDDDGRVVEFNPAAEAMFQYSRASALGRPVAELITPERHRQAHNEGMRRMREGGAPRLLGQRIAMSAVRADGSEFPIDIVLWRTHVGARSFFTASIVDATQAHAAEEQIGRQREALRQSEKLSAMGSLLAGVAHELNNPLAILMGRATLLEARTEGLAHLPEGLGLQNDALRIREAAERCARIVRTFLSMARQKKGQQQPVQLNELVHGAVDLLQYSLRTSGIAVELRLAEELPSVLADGDQLGQVLLNLLVNAQQALTGRPQPLKLRIETGLEEERGQAGGRIRQAWLRVADNGPGVAPGLRERIFDPFFTTKGEGAGTGLGLAFSRSVALEHGGSLRLEEVSPTGSGASFRLSLPLAPPEDRQVPADTRPAALEVEQQARILVVDDEAELAEVIREMLESAGYELATAESGEVALELLAEARFDAIVSDLRMPGMDGPALWREVRLLHPALARRMVFVTGDTLSPAAGRFLADTRCPCVDKPFSKADLLDKVRLVLDQA
ncbi:MAG: PAS domain S-box protein [Burkholderiaceae bacterium]|nr:PAS domain S-box protein [Burkholderiaceae bacterium]